MLVSWHHFLATHTYRTALCPGLPGWAGTRKVKPIWILLKQETVSGSGISWAVCKSAPLSRQITTPAPQQQLVDKESLCSGCFAWQYSLQVLGVSEFWKAFFGFFSAFLCTTICLYASVRVLLNSQKGKTNLDFTEARDSEWQWHQMGPYASLHLAPHR